MQGQYPTLEIVSGLAKVVSHDLFMSRPIGIIMKHTGLNFKVLGSIKTTRRLFMKMG